MINVFNSINWILKGRSGTAAALQTLGARVFILGMNVATGIITARNLGPQGRGEQSAMILWYVFLANTLTLGIPSALVYNFKRYPEEKSRFFSAALLVGTGASLVAIVVGVVCMPWWLSQYSAEVIRAARLFMLFTPIALIQLIILAALEASGDFSASNRLRLLIPFITLAALIVLAATKTLTPFTSSLAYTLNGVPVFFWTLARLWKLLQPRWQEIGTSSKQLLNYGLRSYGVDLLTALSGQIDQVLVVSFLAPVAMGTYVVALSLSRILNVFQLSIVAVLFPKAAARPLEEVISLTGRSARLTTAITLIVGIFIIMLGPFLLQLLYGPEFVEASSLLSILVIEVVLGGTTVVLAQAFMALGRPGVVTILQATGLSLSIPLMMWLIPTFELVGAGIALLASTIIRLIFILICYPLLLKVRSPSLLLTKEDLLYLKSRLVEFKK